MILVFLVQERLGLLYADYRRSSQAVVYFPLMMVMRDLIGGLLVGIQEGESRGQSHVFDLFGYLSGGCLCHISIHGMVGCLGRHGAFSQL